MILFREKCQYGDPSLFENFACIKGGNQTIMKCHHQEWKFAFVRIAAIRLTDTPPASSPQFSRLNQKTTILVQLLKINNKNTSADVNDEGTMRM